jgi:alpha-1,2-mannosyltransferase
MRQPTRWAGAFALVATMLATTFAFAILSGPYRAVERSDYMTYHMAARIVLDGNGSCLYDARCQSDAQRDLIGEEPSFSEGALPYNSPPWLAALMVALGLLPLPVGFAIFTLLGLVVLAWGTWRLTAGVGWPASARTLAVVLVLTAWPTAMAAIRGQSTLLVVGLLGLSVGLPRYRSGLALGLSALKPTLAPLWAIWQLLGGHWRAVGTAAAVAVGLVALSMAVVSPQALIDYPGHLLGLSGQDVAGIHPAEMVNWRGAAERLGGGPVLVIAGSVTTLGLVAFAWLRSSSRQLGAAAAFLATPLVIPHANQHEFVLAGLGMLLAVVALPQMRGRLATLAIGTHALLWAGVVVDAEVGAWLLFGVELAWLLIVVWLSGLESRADRPDNLPLPTDAGE